MAWFCNPYSKHRLHSLVPTPVYLIHKIDTKSRMCRWKKKKNIHSIEFYTGSKEELLPGFEKDFPYIASRAELDKYIGGYVPWHWHRTVELFYMESGSIEYDTPRGKILFPTGSGGMINPNVLHRTKAISQREKNIQQFQNSFFFCLARKKRDYLNLRGCYDRRNIFLFNPASLFSGK